jgi:hypothetical protein
MEAQVFWQIRSADCCLCSYLFEQKMKIFSTTMPRIRKSISISKSSSCPLAYAHALAFAFCGFGSKTETNYN